MIIMAVMIMAVMMMMMMLIDCSNVTDISLHLGNLFNNELIISLDFSCFYRKYTCSSMSAINILELSVGESATLSNESNNLSLNDLTSAKILFYQNIQSNLL